MEIPNYIIVILMSLCSVLSETRESARLLVSKTIQNKMLVESKDLIVQYDLYNIGTSPAFQVNLTDLNLDVADFELVSGSLNVQWQRITSGSNTTHVVVLKPKKSGIFNFTVATVAYFPSETATEPQITYTSAPGHGTIINAKDFDRKFSSHAMDWLAFALMCIPVLVVPFMLWNNSQSRYDGSKIKKN